MIVGFFHLAPKDEKLEPAPLSTCGRRQPGLTCLIIEKQPWRLTFGLR